MAGACLTLATLYAKAGRDQFKVYLNNKLLLEQYVGESVSLKQLQLEKANANDQLTFHYSHCGQIGTSRKIVVEDAKGNIIKKWEFADADGQNSGMVIPVKEVLALQKEDLQFFYASNQLPKGMMIASFHVNNKTTSWQPVAPQGKSHWLLAILFSGWRSAAIC